MQRNQFTDLIIDTSYKLFGTLVPNLPSLKKNYVKSGIKLTFESYIAVAIFACIISFFVAFTVAFLVHSIFGIFFSRSVLGASVLAIISGILSIVALMIYPITRMNKNKNEIDTNLIYTVGYMSVLSSGGASIERIFERVHEIEPHKAIKDLADQFTINIKIFGSDIISSLNDVQVRSPSETFSKLLISINSISKTSGDLKGLLAFETNNLLALKREQLKKRLSGMVALAELYITAMVMAPVTFIIMITLLSVLGNSSMALSPITQLNLIVFFGIPAICVVFIVILDGALSKED
jgi:archaeal flagellar protein FlaJ